VYLFTDVTGVAAYYSRTRLNLQYTLTATHTSRTLLNPHLSFVFERVEDHANHTRGTESISVSDWQTERQCHNYGTGVGQGHLPSRPKGFRNLPCNNSYAFGLRVHSDLVLGGKLGEQEDTTCNGNPGGIQVDETDEAAWKNGSGEPVKNLSRPQVWEKWSRHYRISLFIHFLHKQELSWKLMHTTQVLERAATKLPSGTVKCDVIVVFRFGSSVTAAALQLSQKFWEKLN